MLWLTVIIKQAERALEWMIARIGDSSKTAFGKKLNQHGTILQWVAESRIYINTARLSVLNAALKIDVGDAKGAASEIAQAKVLAPRAVLETLERAIQTYGGAGVSQDTPLAAMWAQARTLKIVDGPDEVHLQQLGRNESKRGIELQAKIERQKHLTEDLLASSKISRRKGKLFSLL
jgi:acyl-CoA dehydrogenase